MPGARIILIAVADGILADSLRFSLELEGFRVKLCDEHTVFSALAAWKPGCLVLDQDVFSRIVAMAGTQVLAGAGIPVVLMIGQKTQRALDLARAAGITRVIEKPLLGGALSDAINRALEGLGNHGSGCGSRR